MRKTCVGATISVREKPQQNCLTSVDVNARIDRCERSYRSLWACVSVEV